MLPGGVLLVIPPFRELYDFQVEGVEFLTRRKPWVSKSNPYAGGFLWDDPGLGKTTQAIVAATKMENFPSHPVLVVCPNSLKLHWAREIRAVVPNAKVAVATVGGRLRKYSQSAGKVLEVSPSVEHLSALGVNWVVVHYEGLRVSQRGYKSIPWGTVIADESHFVKNRNARRTEALMEVTPKGANRIGLTATPYSREPSGLWSQLYWMAPHVPGLQNYWRWFGLFVEFEMVTLRRLPSGKVIESDDNSFPAVRKFRRVVGGRNLEALAEVMDKYGLCRRKSEVASQLPPITDTVMPLELAGRQKTIYEALKDRSRSEFAIGSPEGVTKFVIKNVLSRMTKMEQWLSNPSATDSSVVGAKLEWLKEWASYYEWPAVVVTRFKSTARAVAEVLGVSPITGDIPNKLRDPIIEKWRAGPSPQFLVGTIHTLGTGLNLDRAHQLICFDQVHSPILMTQVRERVHRITSDHPVEVIYLVIEDTSNELVYESFTRKWRELEMVKKFILMLRGEEWRSQ